MSGHYFWSVIPRQDGRIEDIGTSFHAAAAGEAVAALNALSDDEASKLRILDYLRKWLSDKLEAMPADRV